MTVIADAAPGFRVVDLGKLGEWQWRVDVRRATLVDPTGTEHSVPLHRVLEVTPSEFDAMQFEWRDEVFPITTADIGDFIRYRLLKMPTKLR